MAISRRRCIRMTSGSCSACSRLCLSLTLISLLIAGRWVMVCATVAALGLVGYTLYIPSIGTGSYGSSYWVSLAAAVVMTVGAGASAFMPAAT